MNSFVLVPPSFRKSVMVPAVELSASFARSAHFRRVQGGGGSQRASWSTKGQQMLTLSSTNTFDVMLAHVLAVKPHISMFGTMYVDEKRNRVLILSGFQNIVVDELFVMYSDVLFDTFSSIR